jgi:hypothetical protein
MRAHRRVDNGFTDDCSFVMGVEGESPISEDSSRKKERKFTATVACEINGEVIALEGAVV